MKNMKRFLVVFLGVLMGVTALFSVGGLQAKESAVSQNTFFKPLLVLSTAEQNSVFFSFTNTAKKPSKLQAKLTHEYTKHSDSEWMVQFCYSNICYLDEGESPNTVDPGKKEEMHVQMSPYVAYKGDTIKCTLEVWPVVEPKNVTKVMFYGVVVDEGKVELRIDNPQAKVNDKVQTLDAAPFILNSRTVVPLRFIGEALGAEIGWDNNQRMVSYKLGDEILYFWIDKKEVKVVIGPYFAKTIPLEAAPVIRSGRTFVPVRVVSELLGAKVGWDGTTRTVSIDFPAPYEH
ncbi:MAG: copper amine oxidase N-terminal domain-containing protein [Caldisericia bacterium]|nr:copper amine oxidase N-terminal domain-containing protein [Caldisericia bacterium]MDD4615316.1 copper amine oxidase N-terminal domain-containing protein [Caldisericia bacterium]